MADAVLALGGNLGDAAAAIEEALAALARDGVAIVARSSLYRNPAWGPVPQPDYINACALVRTDLPPRGLLATTRRVEAALGRERRLRWGPRTIDLDIVDYAGVNVDELGLTLPHPRFAERAFVLVPLVEIAPDYLIAGRPVRDWAAALDAAALTRL